MFNLDLSLHGLLEGNFFNFLIVFALIVYLLVKMKASAKLDEARENVVKTIKDSDEHKASSEQALHDVKREFQNLGAEILKIEEEAKNTVEAFKKSAQAEIEEVAARMDANANKLIKTEEQKAVSALQKELALNAVTAAHDKTLEALNQNNTMHRKFIKEAIDKIEGLDF